MLGVPFWTLPTEPTVKHPVPCRLLCRPTLHSVRNPLGKVRPCPLRQSQELRYREPRRLHFSVEVAGPCPWGVPSARYPVFPGEIARPERPHGLLALPFASYELLRHLLKAFKWVLAEISSHCCSAVLVLALLPTEQEAAVRFNFFLSIKARLLELLVSCRRGPNPQTFWRYARTPLYPEKLNLTGALLLLGIRP